MAASAHHHAALGITLLPLCVINEQNSYGQWPGSETLADLAVAPETGGWGDAGIIRETLPELDEQLDWAPPELDDETACPPLVLTVASASVLGPTAPLLASAALVELVDELELLAQLPEPPLTPV